MTILDTIHYFIQEHLDSTGEYPDVLYLRQDEYDFFIEWASAYKMSTTHYNHYSLPHKVRIEWDGKVLH